MKKTISLKLKTSLSILAVVAVIIAALWYVCATKKVVLTAAGDYGGNENTRSVFQKINEINPDLHILLGDLSYDEIKPETSWCDFVKKNIESPLVLVTGNHEGDGRNGHIDNFRTCLPNPLSNLVGDYGKEFYFDMPMKDPLVRVIMISPAISFDHGHYSYAATTTHFAWLKNAVEDARAKEIPWLIVGMHKVCIANGEKNCEIGEYLTNYLMSEKVDIILQGHAHDYQRTKQLRCVFENKFADDCVAEQKAPNVYKKGNGSVIVIAGTGGVELRKIKDGNGDRGYFAELRDDYFGVEKFTISKNELRGQFKTATDGTKDEFVIVK
jgi:predicted phosphodiesterase